MTPVLEVEELVKRFPTRGGRLVHAVNGVSFRIEEEESLALVGETGCGKTTVGRCILRLIEPTSGSIRFRGRELTRLRQAELRPLRSQMQVVFQEPYESLSPRFSVADIVAEPLVLHRPNLSRRERERQVSELLEKVRLRPELACRRPHELSGGQQQRVAIARAIATKPSFIVLDEPTSSLDVSVRAQILSLLLDLQRQERLAYLFISHDLSSVQYSCANVAVMYLGRIVEYGPTQEIFYEPRHPYTRALLSSILRPDVDQAGDRIKLQGEVPSAVELPQGCAFASRCPIAVHECSNVVPPLRTIGINHRVACIRADEVPTLMRPAMRVQRSA